ncbi:MAG TPA: protein kinase [Polyangiaceae bacterium]|nr:protein kinase [Polyangiaceae bacterium]
MEDQSVQRCRARIGTLLNGKWRLDELLGVGGMAAVYLATHRNGKEVAIKVLHPEASQSAEVRERFLREGYAANRVKHEGAVSVFDDDVAEDGSAFLVMELLDGETLEARRERKGGRLPAEEVLSVMDRVLDTLAAAHEQGIVHRDLKPENLFLTANGSVKILDFGIARLREVSGQKSSTQTGSTMGTPAFMAPEQARGRWNEVDARTDLWAVGATMFTLLSGHYVHEAGTVNESIALAVTQRARSVATVAPDLAAPVVQFVDKALTYESDGRFPNAQAMQDELRRTYHAIADGGADSDASASPGAGPGQTLRAPPALIAEIARRSAAMTTSGVAASSPVQTSPSGRAIGAALAVVVAAGALVALIHSRGTGGTPAPPAADVPSAANVAPSRTTTPAASLPSQAPASRVDIPVVDVAALPTTDEPRAVKPKDQAASPHVATVASSTAIPAPVRAEAIPEASLPTPAKQPIKHEKSREELLLQRR